MQILRFCAGIAAALVLLPACYAWDAADRAVCEALAERAEQGFEDLLFYNERHCSQFNYKGWELWQIEVPKMLRQVAVSGKVDMCSPSGFSALQAACYYADVELAKALIDAGADVNLRPTGWKGYGFPGDTPIALLVRGMTPETSEARVQIARMLLAKGADPDSSMMHWVWGGSYPVMPFGYLSNAPHNNAMRLALLEGGGRDLLTRTRSWAFAWDTYTPEIIRKLLDAGVSPNRGIGENGATLLYYLVRRGEAELVQLAIDKGAEVKASDRMKHYLGDYLFALPVDEADSAENSVRIAEMLVAAKANLKATYKGQSLYAFYRQYDTPAARALVNFFASKGVRH